MVQITTRDAVLEAGRALGFDLVGVAGAGQSARQALFPKWVESGRAGTMAYLARRGESGRYLREQVREAWPWARSVLCAASVYNTAAPHSPAFAADRERGWISRYAWGEDYHRVMRDRLEQWIQRVRELAGGADGFQATVDTAPLLEREVARLAGLGWQGKNTCLIHPQQGSFLFLGCVVTSLELEPDEPLPDRCGSCRRCLEACPTGALTPYEMDARRCLAYLNIELRGTIPEEFRSAMGNNLIGCDICQDVCPWNGSVHGREAVSQEAAFQPRPGLVAPLLAELAAMTEEAYRERFRHSAVKRAKFSGLRRNLAVAMGNSGNPAFLPILQDWGAGADPELAEHARWARVRIHETTRIADGGGGGAEPGGGGA